MLRAIRLLARRAHRQRIRILHPVSSALHAGQTARTALAPKAARCATHTHLPGLGGRAALLRLRRRGARVEGRARGRRARVAAPALAVLCALRRGFGLAWGGFACA